MKARAQAAFAAYVRGRDDRTLERAIGSRLVMRIVFEGMRRTFVSERAAGFEGEIEYVLTRSGDRRPRRWIVEVAGGRASVRRGAAGNPAVTVSAPVPVFARIAASELHPARAMLDGDLTIAGDLGVAARLGEMFGGAPSSRAG